MSEPASEGQSGPGTASETAAYAAEIAHELTLMCERVGLITVSALFYAAAGEAERALARLDRRSMGRR